MDNTGAWDETTGRAVGSYLTQSENSTPKPSQPKRPKLSPELMAIIGELAWRFNLSRDTDPDEAKGRIRLLAESVAHVNLRTLKIACDKLAHDPDRKPFFPAESELLAKVRDAEREGQSDEARIAANQLRVAERNAKLEAEGKPMRWYSNGFGPWELREYRA